MIPGKFTALILASTI